MRENTIMQLRGQGWSESTLTVWLRARGRCEYCDKDLAGSVDDYFFGYNIDHVVPASAGGVNDVSNYALACRACNLMKWNRDFRNGESAVARSVLVERARSYVHSVREASRSRMLKSLELIHTLE